MKLSVIERILVQGMLPKETNFVTLKIIRELEGALGFSEEEVKQLKFVTEGQTIKWDTEADKNIGEIEVKIGEKAADVISESLKNLDKENKLTANMVTLYEKFIENNKEK
jgi:hypothetical protein